MSDFVGEGFDPESGILEFGRHRRGTVHVLVPLQPGDDELGKTGLSLGPFTASFRTRTPCGRVLPVADVSIVSAFADDQTCMSCHKAMGEHSDRLFEHPTS